MPAETVQPYLLVVFLGSSHLSTRSKFRRYLVSSSDTSKQKTTTAFYESEPGVSRERLPVMTSSRFSVWSMTWTRHCPGRYSKERLTSSHHFRYWYFLTLHSLVFQSSWRNLKPLAELDSRVEGILCSLIKVTKLARKGAVGANYLLAILDSEI